MPKPFLRWPAASSSLLGSCLHTGQARKSAMWNRLLDLHGSFSRLSPTRECWEI